MSHKILEIIIKLYLFFSNSPQNQFLINFCYYMKLGPARASKSDFEEKKVN